MTLPWEHEVRLYAEGDRGEGITAHCTDGGCYWESEFPDGIATTVVHEASVAHMATHPARPGPVTGARRDKAVSKAVGELVSASNVLIAEILGRLYDSAEAGAPPPTTGGGPGQAERDDIAEEVAGMIADEIGSRLFGGSDGSDIPPAVNSATHANDPKLAPNVAVIYLEDGRRVVTAVTVEGGP